MIKNLNIFVVLVFIRKKLNEYKEILRYDKND